MQIDPINKSRRIRGERSIMNVKIIRRGMIYVATSGTISGKGYTEQEALNNLKKKLNQQRDESAKE
ncbi:hypothetical protein HMPREF9374_0776 [Desmospora sp. 8437]|nr:hypothetical protein HMPREF9374_0776 [Desmospora sp. 8437]